MNLKTLPHHKSHHASLLAAAGIVRNQRRSKRMGGLSASVGLSGEDRQKCSFTIPARATNLNKHGGAVQLTRDLAIGSVVQVRHKNGSQVAARIVAQLASPSGVPTYAIEFVEQESGATNFWGITFPSNA